LVIFVLAMILRDFLSEYEGGAAAFAAAIGVTAQAVYRYASGERIPRRAVMLVIAEKSDGKVRPTDFYAAPTGVHADAVEAANENARRRGDANTMAPVRHERVPEAA